MAYGLGLSSEIPLLELEACDAPVDITIRLGKVNLERLEAVDSGHRFWGSPDQACHFFERAGAFLARYGREIIVDPIPSADERALRLSLLGPALAIILMQRGRLVLHASAVAIGGYAIAFLGGHGWGKSTMAAALHQRRHDMVVDDVMAVYPEAAQVMAIPSFPQFKLWPQAVSSVSQTSPEALPLLLPYSEKRMLRITQGFAQAALPLKRLYVLAKRATLDIEPLSHREALTEVMRHAYGARFGKQFFQVTDIATHFLQCAHLANSISVCRLTRPSCLARLSDVAQMVETDLAHALECHREI